jgi:ubiquinol-cytochrome c reductase cytochrome b subunit
VFQFETRRPDPCYVEQNLISMRLLKTHPILGLMNSYMVDSPQPASISYMWNFGSLLGACLVIQIVTGITLAMHYTPNIDLAFVSVEHIMRDVHYG